MNEVVKQKWIAALLSGEYVQGMAYMESEGTYCCLGVLCDIYTKENNIAIGDLFDGDLNTPYLPNKVFEWAGLPNESVILEDYEVEDNDYDLAELNDNGMPFTEIAKIIEKYA